MASEELKILHFLLQHICLPKSGHYLMALSELAKNPWGKIGNVENKLYRLLAFDGSLSNAESAPTKDKHAPSFQSGPSAIGNPGLDDLERVAPEFPARPNDLFLMVTVFWFWDAGLNLRHRSTWWCLALWKLTRSQD